MTQSGIPPAVVQGYIDALPTEEERVHATIDFAATEYYRDDQTLISMMEANGWSPADIDNFFIEAAQL
jgi:hypothetical protein